MNVSSNIIYLEIKLDITFVRVVKCKAKPSKCFVEFEIAGEVVSNYYGFREEMKSILKRAEMFT